MQVMSHILKKDEYCIIPLENNGQYSLTEAYNIIWKQAEELYPLDNTILVLCHHDIHFKNQGWGKNLLNIFNNNEVDIVGLAGTDKFYYHGAWWLDSLRVFNQKDLWGKVWHTDGKKEWQSNFTKEKKCAKLQPVIAIDGLFMAFNPITCSKFDEDFKGFHYYEISFCINNFLKGCKLAVTETIQVCHESGGALNQEWENNRNQFISKYMPEGKTLEL